MLVAGRRNGGHERQAEIRVDEGGRLTGMGGQAEANRYGSYLDADPANRTEGIAYDPATSQAATTSPKATSPSCTEPSSKSYG